MMMRLSSSLNCERKGFGSLKEKKGPSLKGRRDGRIKPLGVTNSCCYFIYLDLHTEVSVYWPVTSAMVGKSNTETCSLKTVMKRVGPRSGHRRIGRCATDRYSNIHLTRHTRLVQCYPKTPLLESGRFGQQPRRDTRPSDPQRYVDGWRST